MTRERLTNKKVAGDASLGQSANDYWMNKARNFLQSAWSQVDKQLAEEAQKLAENEARQVGVAPMSIAPAPAPAPESVVTPGQEETKMASEKIFEPKSRKASAPVNPGAIGAQKWCEMQLQFPQYIRDPNLQASEADPKKMQLLSIPNTRYNRPAVQAIIHTLDGVASKLESVGDTESALQLDIVSELLTASVEEAKRFENTLIAGGDVEAKKKEEEEEKCE
jgi:hypothetical protein